jgi:hypothetical protein
MTLPRSPVRKSVSGNGAESRYCGAATTIWSSARWWIWLGQDAEVRRTPELPLFLANASLLLIPLFAASLARLTGLALGLRFILPLFLIAP